MIIYCFCWFVLFCLFFFRAFLIVIGTTQNQRPSTANCGQSSVKFSRRLWCGQGWFDRPSTPSSSKGKMLISSSSSFVFIISMDGATGFGVSDILVSFLFLLLCVSLRPPPPPLPCVFWILGWKGGDGWIDLSFINSKRLFLFWFVGLDLNFSPELNMSPCISGILFSYQPAAHETKQQKKVRFLFLRRISLVDP